MSTILIHAVKHTVKVSYFLVQEVAIVQTRITTTRMTATAILMRIQAITHVNFLEHLYSNNNNNIKISCVSICTPCIIAMKLEGHAHAPIKKPHPI